MRVALKDIKANPFRHIDRYPINPDKVAALRKSIQTTGFWDNVVAREVDGKVEIAYGHHRLVALREEYKPGHEVELIIRDLDDGAMVKIMANENLEEWGSSVVVEHETIRAVVEAFGAGLIELDEPGKDVNKSRVRYAPSFVAGGDAGRARGPRLYTAQSVADFLGWTEPAGKPQDKVRNALAALGFIEEGILKESDFEGLTTKQAEAAVVQARQVKARRDEEAAYHAKRAKEAEAEQERARKAQEQAEKDREKRQAQADAAKGEAERKRRTEEARQAAERERVAERERAAAEKQAARAREAEGKAKEKGRDQATAAGRAVAHSIKTGKKGYREAGAVADRATGEKPRERRMFIDEFGRKLATQLHGYLGDSDPNMAKLREITRNVEHLSDPIRAMLFSVLTKLSARVLSQADLLAPGAIKRPSVKLVKGRS